MVGIQSSSVAGKEMTTLFAIREKKNLFKNHTVKKYILKQGTLSISPNRSYFFLDGHLLCDTFFIPFWSED